jgi:hypothetical protein
VSAIDMWVKFKSPWTSTNNSTIAHPRIDFLSALFCRRNLSCTY